MFRPEGRIGLRFVLTTSRISSAFKASKLVCFWSTSDVQPTPQKHCTTTLYQWTCLLYTAQHLQRPTKEHACNCAQLCAPKSSPDLGAEHQLLWGHHNCCDVAKPTNSVICSIASESRLLTQRNGWISILWWSLICHSHLMVHAVCHYQVAAVEGTFPAKEQHTKHRQCQ